MCNDDCDLNRVNKHKPSFDLFDKIVLGFTFTIMTCCLVMMVIGIFYPERLICN